MDSPLPIPDIPAEERLLIHIGYTKAGSTWLQRFLFENESAGFGLVDRPASVEHLILPHALEFDPRTARDELRPHVEESATAGRAPVISAERLSGSPHSGGYDTPALADRLHDVYPAAKVLIVIREQRQIIASTYKQYVRVGGVCRPSRYFSPPQDPRIPLFSFEYFDYHRLIKYYYGLYGRESVLVLPFEAFLKTGDDFVARICRFAGVAPVQGLPYHVTLKGAASPFVRTLTRWRNMVSEPTSINVHTLPVPIARRCLTAVARLDPAVPAPVQARLERSLRTYIDRQVGHRYRASNRITAELTGLDLGALGYDV